MGQPLIEFGEKLHVINRGNFVGDPHRHFVGTLRASSGTVIRLQGYAFAFESGDGNFHRMPELRTQIFGLGDPQLIINVVHPDTILDKIVYERRNGRLHITDGGKLDIDLDEFDIKD